MPDSLDQRVSPAVIHVRYLAVTNFSSFPGSVEGCIPKDARGKQIPVAQSYIQTQERSGWQTLHDAWRLRCFNGKMVLRKIWPLMSFYAEPSFMSRVGRKGDWVRITALSHFEDRVSRGREFVCAPFHLLILTSMDSLVAPTSQYGLSDLENVKSTIGWGRDTRVDDVKLVRVPWLQPRERRLVRISGFDLRPMLKDADTGGPFDGRSYALWPWWIRVNVRVETTEGDRVAASSGMCR